MNFNRYTARQFILYLGVYLLSCWVVSTFVLSSFDSLSLTLESDEQDTFSIYYSAGDYANFSDQRRLPLGPFPAGEKATKFVPFGNHLAGRLRIDPGSRANQVKLYRLELSSHFGNTLKYDAAAIYDQFSPNAHVGNYSLVDDHIALSVIGKDPQLVSKNRVSINNPLMKWVYPAILTLVIYLLFSGFKWREHPAISDLSRDLSSTHINYAALDGFRGIAVLLVLLDHTVPAFKGAGTAGVWMFFVLSGFLLTIPFVDQPERALSGSYMRQYMLRRLKRIIPMYYLYVTVFFVMAGDVSGRTALHLLFLQGEGHLWTIQQELLFYLLLPFITAGVYLLFRGRVIWTILTLAALMTASNMWLDQSVIALQSDHNVRPPFVGVFVAGMILSYLYHGVVLKKEMHLLQSGALASALSLFGIGLMVIYILLSTDTLLNPGYYPALKHPGWFGLAACIMILIVLTIPGTLYSGLLSLFPLRAIGLVGYSFYLLHPPLITLVLAIESYYLGYNIDTWTRFAIVFVFSYLLSAITYTYIERPFLGRNR